MNSRENIIISHLAHISAPMEVTKRCIRSSRAISTAWTPRDVTLPAFLVPAFAQRSRQTSAFSTSSRCASKVGRAPLSLPPDVTFQIHQTPPPKAGRQVSRTQVGSTVNVKGPLGEMSMQIPSFVSIESTGKARTYTLSVLNKEDKDQRAMWGA